MAPDCEKMREVKQLIAALLEMSKTEEEEDIIFSRISVLSPDPEWSDHIFHSNEYSQPDGGFDIDGVVAKIFNYKPILL